MDSFSVGLQNERHLNDLNEVKKYAQDINNKIDQSIQVCPLHFCLLTVSLVPLIC